jgi:hypothetical protein
MIWAGVALCVVGLLAIAPFFRLLTAGSKRRSRLGAADVADRIEKHISGTEGPWDWDDFTSFPIASDELDQIRLQCIESEQNVEELKRIIDRLRRSVQRSDAANTHSGKD